MSGASFFRCQNNSNGAVGGNISVRHKLCILLAMLLMLPAYAAVAAITEKDVKVIARVISLIQDGPRGNVRVIVVSDGVGAQADIDSFLDIIGTGKRVGDITLTAQAISLEGLASAPAQVVLIPAGLNAAQLDRIFEIARRKQWITISTSEDCLTLRKCAIAIKSSPAVDIKLSSSAAADTGVQFGSAFRMMIKETP